MGRYRDFDAARAERAGEQIEFKVGGEEFAVDGTLPGGVILELAEAMASGDQFAAMGLTAELFKGIVRPEDIDTRNTVESTRVADATLVYVGDGQVSKATTMGWLAKFFISAIMPF